MLMSIFDTSRNKAICVLPFVHEFVETTGKVKPCCHGDTFTGEEDKDTLKKMMLDGQKPEACRSCYKAEQESAWSYRLKYTNDWIKKHGSPDTDNQTLQSIDLRFDPTCNLKCKTCGPYASTLWQKEKGISQPKNTHTREYFLQVDKAKLKHVYLAGGEPTYIHAYFDFLAELYKVNKECEVVINTNLKKLPEQWKSLIKKFPNLTIVCSCDATETLGSYVRYPLGWEEFERNVEYVSEHANFLQFNLVASNLTSHKIHETCNWMGQYSKHINLSILKKPEVFSGQAVPTEHRHMYIDSLKQIKKFPISIYYATQFRTEVNSLLDEYANVKYDESLHKALRREIDDQDSHRHLKLIDVDPFLHSWIYN